MGTERSVTLIVKSIPEAGFWRCGRKWTSDDTEAQVTETEAKVLRAEPKLLVRDAPEAQAAKADQKK